MSPIDLVYFLTVCMYVSYTGGIYAIIIYRWYQIYTYPVGSYDHVNLLLGRSYIVDCGGALKCRLWFTVDPRCFVPVCFWADHVACFLGWFVRFHRVLSCDRSSIHHAHSLTLNSTQLNSTTLPSSSLLRDRTNNKHTIGLGACFCHRLCGA